MRDYKTILGQLNVPIAARKGLSVGRLLMDYPSTTPIGDGWFNRFLTAYRIVVQKYDRHVVI